MTLLIVSAKENQFLIENGLYVHIMSFMLNTDVGIYFSFIFSVSSQVMFKEADLGLDCPC